MEIALGMWMAMVVGAIPLLWWFLWHWNDFWFSWRFGGGTTTELPPGGMGIPFFGEMFHFLWYFKVLRRPDDFITNKRNKYGDGEGLCKTHLFGSPSIIAWSPAANKFVLQDSNFTIGWPGTGTKISGDTSLIALQGPSHARVRGLVLKAVSQPEPLRKIAMIVQPRIVAAFQQWAEKGRVVALQEIKKVTFANIGKYFCGLEPGPHLQELDRLCAGIIKGVRSQPINIPGTTYHHAVECRKKVLAFFEKQFNKRKLEGPGAEFDLLDQLMHLRDDDGNKLLDDEVLDNIVGLIIAGYESTSLAIMWTVYFVAKHPDVYKKLREENMTIGANGELVTRDDILKLQYTSKVVEESLRLANLGGFVFRKADKDIEYKGYKIPKGWKVIAWMRYVHMNSKNYEDPLSFNPDRWNEQPKPGPFLAFSGGPRICPGNLLARMQIAIFIHHLCIGYRWELVNPKAPITYLPHPFVSDGAEINISKI